MDTVLSAPRASYPDIVKLTDKQVQAGNFQDLKVVPGYYTVATDRGTDIQYNPQTFTNAVWVLGLLCEFNIYGSMSVL